MEQSNCMNPHTYPEKELAIFQAVQLLLHQGADPATLKVSDIAAAAGIGKGTVYEYFPSKEDIFSKSLAFGLRSLLEDAESTMLPEKTFAGKLHAVLESIEKNALIWRVIFQTSQRPKPDPRQWQQHESRIGLLLEDILQAAVAEGLLPADRHTYGGKALLNIICGFVVMYVGGFAVQAGALSHADVLHMAVGALQGAGE